ncbi:hypothetical protein DFH09DRAFT_1114222 [Mycena vulgaris]|nr:hypothetical protein DFH09DRAFT_1114222 [Mycena vulgaris]
MARTSMTAKKSTGGPAPKKALGQVDAAPDDDHASVDAPPPSKKRKVERKTAKASHQAAVPTAQESVAVEFNPQANKWCAGCENGGTMYACALCNRYMCDQCLDFLPPDQMASPNVAWYCPKCWLRGDNIPHWKEKGKSKKWSRGMGYYGLWRNGKPIDRPMTLAAPQTMRALWPICDTSPLAVISLRLDGMQLLGDPAALIVNHLAPYYAEQPFFFESINYNLDTGLTAYTRNIAALTKRLARYKPEKIVVLLTTHTVPGSGMIHMAPGGLAANDPSLILPCLFPEPLCGLIRSAKTSMLILQGCGALNQGEARDQVSQFVNSSGFQSAFAFSVAEFLPSAANTFLMDVVYQFCVAGHAQKFHHLLARHYSLGQFTDIIVYLPLLRVFRYAWSHPSTRPYGTPIRRQCGNPKCLSLASLKIEEYTEDEVVLRCTHCTEDTTYERGNLFLLEGIWDGARRTIQGAWYGEWLANETENARLCLDTDVPTIT